MSDDIKLPKPSGWVSVYDRMPDSDAEVLVYVPSNEPARVWIDSWSMRREAPWSLSSTTVETGFAWGNFEFEEVSHWMPMPAAPHDFAMFTADQLRAAVLADRAERASAAEQASIGDAIRKGRRCVDRLDGYYDFECEGGPLRMNVEWDILKRSFEHLCRHIERAHGIVEKESGKCNRCGGEMKPGQAMQGTLVGEPDDLGGVVTVSPGGPGKLVPCMKCAECGWSVKT